MRAWLTSQQCLAFALHRWSRTLNRPGTTRCPPHHHALSNMHEATATCCLVWVGCHRPGGTDFCIFRLRLGMSPMLSDIFMNRNAQSGSRKRFEKLMQTKGGALKLNRPVSLELSVLVYLLSRCLTHHGYLDNEPLDPREGHRCDHVEWKQAECRGVVNRNLLHSKTSLFNISILPEIRTVSP